MREIRVRAKCIEEGEHRGQWITGFGVHIFEGDEVEAQLYTTEGVIAVDPATVGQYTGWQDDTKKDVYEGDKAINLITGDIYEVVWDSDGSQFSFAGKHDWYDFYELDDRYGSPNNCLRVIGNRWDTP